MYIKDKFNWSKHMDFMVIDLLTLIVSFVFSYYLKFGNLDGVTSSEWAVMLLLVCMLNIIISLAINPYSGMLSRAYYEDIKVQIKLVLYNFLSACVVMYVVKMGNRFSREMILTMYAVYLIGSFLIKMLWKKMILSGRATAIMPPKKLLYVVAPEGKIDDVIKHALSTDFQLYTIAGSCDESGIDEFVQKVLKENISEVLIAVNPELVSKEDYVRLIDNCVGVHIDVNSLLGFETEDQRIDRIGTYKTLSVGMFDFSPRQIGYLGFKRLLDIMCGIFGLIILIPITVIVKICTLLSGDTAKIFYTQKRVGLHGKEIKIYKFRSMVPNADEMLHELLKDEKYKKEWDENQKFEDDPRITKIGRVIRRLSIDEIPQVLNVLKGDMSLIGPRPLVEDELEKHGGLKLYNQIKPGITGWWGCNGRSNIDYQERLELEYYYVKNCSLYLDFLCFVRTVVAVLKRDGSK